MASVPRFAAPVNRLKAVTAVAISDVVGGIDWWDAVSAVCILAGILARLLLHS